MMRKEREPQLECVCGGGAGGALDISDVRTKYSHA